VATISARNTAAAVLAATQNANYTASAVVRATKHALTPTPALGLPSLATPNATDFVSSTTYRNDKVGIAFEYPTYLSMPPYAKNCAPSLNQGPDGYSITIGERLWLSGQTIDQSRISLAAYVDQIIARYQSDGDTNLQSVTWGRVGGVRSVTLEYRFGGLGRYGTETYFMRHDVVYRVVFSAGGTCDMVAREEQRNVLGEFEAYWLLLWTWEFLD
jgi:hypothetical protein